MAQPAATKPTEATRRRIIFKIPYQTKLGQSLGVVGNAPETGAWDGAKGERLPVGGRGRHGWARHDFAGMAFPGWRSMHLLNPLRLGGSKPCWHRQLRL